MTKDFNHQVSVFFISLTTFSRMEVEVVEGFDIPYASMMCFLRVRVE
jgi:hypothetical protein